MIERIFFDTNIVLDILNKERPQHKKAALLWRKAILYDIDIFISEDMLSTIYYVEKEKSKTLDFFEVILRRWHVVPYGTEVIQEALAVSTKFKWDFEDVLQACCAKHHSCSHLVTNDQKFVRYEVDVVDTAEMLELI